MSSPLQFYRTFKALLQEHGIRHALTSGMACVEYGIQQTTKDTDWIVDPEQLPELIALLARLEPGLTGQNWRISYRPLFGAPLLPEYLAAGWTSHLAIHDGPNSPEHHLDFFGQPPRIGLEEALRTAPAGIASLHVIAQMKKTDRDKDWPIVEALGQLAAYAKDWSAILHSRDPGLLARLWSTIPEQERAEFSRRRPLLKQLNDTAAADRLPRLLTVERAFWEQVNKQRYRRFQHEWKEFLRRWRQQDDFAWPVALPFLRQHQLGCDAARAFDLPIDPVDGTDGRQAISTAATATVAKLLAATDAELASIIPPLQEVLP